MKNKTAIVIGGGLSGLATAAQLGHAGYKVTLIEKNKTLGGRARVFTKNGFVFDMGPSWYMMPKTIEKFFKSLNRKSSDYYSLKELTTKYKIYSDSRSPITIVSSLKKNLKLFEQLDPGVSKNFLKLLDKTSKAYKISLKLLNKSYNSIFDFFDLKLIIGGFSLLLQFNPFQSYFNFTNKYIRDPLIQKIVQFHTVFLGGTPFITPALYSILIAADFNEKIWYPIGGIGQLPLALEKICNELGVKIVTNQEVESLEISKSENKIIGVKTKLKTFNADIVVNSSDYAYFDTNLLPSKYQEYSKEYWDSRDYAISSILIYLGLSKKIPSLSHHNFYFQDDWKNHFDTINNTSEFPEKPNFYVCAPSVSDSLVSPKGKENLFVLVPLSVKTKRINVEKYADQVLKHIEDKIGESFIEQIEYMKIFSQNDFIKSYNAYKGNALGISHTLSQSVFLRPRMKSKKLKNLYYVGQFTQPGIGVPMALLSAQYIIFQILNDNYEK